MTPPPPKPQPKPVEVRKPADPPPPSGIHVSKGTQEARIIRRVIPIYPPLAKRPCAGHRELQGVIGVDGRIEHLQVLGGHPLLVQAAVDAVKQWLYRPTLLERLAGRSDRADRGELHSELIGFIGWKRHAGLAATRTARPCAGTNARGSPSISSDAGARDRRQNTRAALSIGKLDGFPCPHGGLDRTIEVLDLQPRISAAWLDRMLPGGSQTTYRVATGQGRPSTSAGPVHGRPRPRANRSPSSARSRSSLSTPAAAEAAAASPA